MGDSSGSSSSGSSPAARPSNEEPSSGVMTTVSPEGESARTTSSTERRETTQQTRRDPPPPQPRLDDGPLVLDCGDLSLPEKFSSFSGHEAHNIADCSWDFFSCTERYGVWPNNKVCCEQRFNRCSMLVMGR